MKAYLKIAKLQSDVHALERKLKWAENMLQHYCEAGYLPNMSREEALKFINGGPSDNPYDRIAKARTILLPSSRQCENCKFAVWALEGNYVTREARLKARRDSKKTTGNSTHPKLAPLSVSQRIEPRETRNDPPHVVLPSGGEPKGKPGL